MVFLTLKWYLIVGERVISASDIRKRWLPIKMENTDIP